MQLSGVVVCVRIGKTAAVDANAGRYDHLLAVEEDGQRWVDMRIGSREDRRQRRTDRHREARFEHLERRAKLTPHFAATGIAALPKTTKIFQGRPNERAARMTHVWLKVPSSRDDEPLIAQPRLRLLRCLDQPASNRIERRPLARVPLRDSR